MSSARARASVAPALTLAVLAAGLLAVAAARPDRASGRPDRLRLPPIVFVSRHPVPGDPFAVPGLGPHHRAIVTGGRLMLRESDGTVRELLPGRFDDVSGPAVSPDARRVAFAAHDAAGGWRVQVLALADGTVADDRDVDRPRDDLLDPCWIGDSLLCVVRAPHGERAQYANVPATQLMVVDARDSDRQGRRRTTITHERNGAASPAWDPTTGRIVYARWWFNRWAPADTDPRGVTEDPARSIARDSVNLWQIVSILPDGTGERVEASGLTTRLASMGDQPAVLADGSIVATFAANLGLSPGPLVLGIQRFAPRLGRARRLIGAVVEDAGSGYGTPRGLAAPSACCPVGLPDGRILFSYAPGARGDYGLYVMDRDGGHVEKVVDLPGTLELDAAPVVRRRGANAAVPASSLASADRSGPATFRFFDRDVFGGGHARPGVHAAPPRTPGARIRFWTTHPHADRDTVELVREVPVRSDGSVDEILPADTPMFEQLVDANGRILRSADGPAHVAGFNNGRPGAKVACIGCHTGHSTIRVEPPK